MTRKAKRGAAHGGRAEGKDRAIEVMAAARLVLTVWELVWTLVRDHASGGGPGQIL